MSHREYVRVVPGSRKTVVFIHGIVGSPRHFDFLIPCVPPDYNIYNLLLPGHGSTVEAFGSSSMEAWQRYVSDILDTLKGHRIALVGHSMGTLFAIQEAIRRPEQIVRLFLLAVPLYPFVTPAAGFGAFCKALGIPHPTGARMVSDGSVTLTPKLWKYGSWIPRFWELLVLCRRTRQCLAQLTVTALAFQSQKDQMVSRRSDRLLQTNPVIQVTVLPQSCHFDYPGEDGNLIKNRFREIMTNI